jgi:hypothetical protein
MKNQTFDQCGWCGAPLARKEGESAYRFQRRQFCGYKCSSNGTAKRNVAIRWKPLIYRFMSKVDERCYGECWRWIGKKVSADGRGAIVGENGKLQIASRVSYELFCGSIPDGKEIHHECHNGWCVNPQHLIPVTRQENMFLERREVCGRGHRMDVENIGNYLLTYSTHD